MRRPGNDAAPRHPPRLVVNAAIVGARAAGLAVAARELSRGLGGYAGVLVLARDPALFPGAACESIPEWASSSWGWVGGVPRFLWTQAVLPRRLARLGARRLLSPNHELVLFPPCPQVAMVHDLLPLLFPGNHPRQGFFYRRVLPWALRRAERVVTVSENTKRDLVRCYGIAPERVSVVPLGVDNELFRPGRGEPPARPYVMGLGSRYRYKNLARLVEAFGLLVADGVPHDLVVAGTRSPELEDAVRRAGIEGRVRCPGLVPDEGLAALYARADAFVFPSLYEGFGLPVLEAMASGCPVLAARTSSLPEVCGEAALFFDPEDPRDLAATLGAVLSDVSLRTRLREAGLARAREFPWSRTVRGLAEASGLGAP